MSFLKDLVSFLVHLLSRLLTSAPELCLRTSSMLAYLLSIKESGHYGWRFKVFKAFQYTFFLGIVIRMVNFNVFLLAKGDPHDYLTFDPYLSVTTITLHVLNQYTLALVGFVALDGLMIDVAFFFKLDYRILKVAWEIGVQNVERCLIRNGSSIGALPFTLRRLWTLGDQLSRAPRNRVHFQRADAQGFLRLSKELEVHLVRVAILSETLVWAVNLIIRVLCMIIWPFQLCAILELVPTPLLPIAIFDLTYLFFCSIHVGALIIFFGHLCFLFNCLFVGHLKQLRKSTSTSIAVIEKTKGKECMRNQIATLLAQLTFFHSEHCKVYLFQEHLNRQIVSSLMWITVLMNLLVNAVVLNFLLIGNTAPLEKLFIIVLAFFELSLGFSVAYTFISMVAPLYACERTLFRAQGAISFLKYPSSQKRILTAKLRLMNFLEFVCTNEKFAFTVGTASKISKKAVFELIFGYSGFFLFITKLLRKFETVN